MNENKPKCLLKLTPKDKLENLSLIKTALWKLCLKNQIVWLPFQNEIKT